MMGTRAAHCGPLLRYLSGGQGGDGGRLVQNDERRSSYSLAIRRKTEDGWFIPEAEFFSATRCKNCHATSIRSGARSLHRTVAREPFYKENIDILCAPRGSPTRHLRILPRSVVPFSEP
jgi:hypothetical protein